MSENKTDAAPDGEKSPTSASKPDGSGKTDSDLVSRAELEEAISRRDAALAKARRLETELNEARDKSRRKSNEDATASNDVETLRKNAEAREAELLEQIKTTQGKFTKLALEDGVKRMLDPKLFLDTELIWLLLGDQFELAEDEKGGVFPRVKNSTLSVPEFVERELTKRGKERLLASGRKNGTSAEPGKTDGSPAGAMTLEQLQKLSPAEQRAAMAKDPGLARQALRLWK